MRLRESCARRPELVRRLLAVAEDRAGEGRRAAAFVLLRWASRLAARQDEALVLLSYYRIKAVCATSVEAAARGPVEQLAHLSSAVVDAGDIDRLGFPVPRFPTAVPELDRSAFIPAPLALGGVTVAPRSGSGSARAASRRRGLGSLAVFLLCAAAFARFGGELRRDPLREAEGALQAGDARRAVSLSLEAEQSAPRTMLVRGRAELALGDTAAARRSLVSAAASPLATAGECREAARALMNLPGAEAEGADAYLRAFRAGLPRGEWPQVIDALERAGRRAQADRLRAMLRGLNSTSRGVP